MGVLAYKKEADEGAATKCSAGHDILRLASDIRTVIEGAPPGAADLPTRATALARPRLRPRVERATATWPLA